MLIPAVITLGGLGLVFGGILAYASKKFSVDIDEKVQKTLAVLPGINCGACGYASCAKYAEEVAANNAPVNGCIPGGADVAEQIAEVLGVDPLGAADKYVAQLVCLGGCDVAGDQYIYDGFRDCRSAVMYGGGPKACRYACVGQGTCVAVCPVDAIVMGDNGLPVIDQQTCISCGKCKDICPRSVIEMVNVKARFHVRCRSQDKGKRVKQVCERGCIACRLCVKKCPVDAISMDKNVAVIDPDKCINCGDCVEVCPQDTIEEG